MIDINLEIFNRINRLQGRNKWLDSFARAGGEWGVVAMFGWFVASIFISCTTSSRSVFWYLIIYICVVLIGWLLDLGIGFLVKKPRPEVSNPDSKQLFKPLMNWKSFPSDHAMATFLMFFLALVFGLPGVWSLLILALWVAFGRIYAGVHYPIDILGGVTVAVCLSIWAKFILFNFL